MTAVIGLGLAVVCAGLWSGLLLTLTTILHPIYAAEDGRGFALALRGFLPVARRSPTNYVLVVGLVVAPVVALVGLWDDPGGVPFVLTAVGLALTVIGPLLTSRLLSEPTYDVILGWDPDGWRSRCSSPRPTPTWRKRGPRVTDLSLGQQIAASRPAPRGRIPRVSTRLGTRALNRATLARQLLLERAELPVLDAVSHVCGLQAQEPQEPFVGLWSRLRGFDPAALSGLLVDRRVVRTHLMRRTVHLVTAEDALAWRSRHGAMLLQRVLGVYRRELAEVDLDELAAAAGRLMADGTPRSLGDIGRALADRWPGPPPRVLGETVIGALVPMVQLPPRGLWRTNAGAQHLPLATWTGRGVEPAAPDGSDPVGEALVRRYLTAFGPAATADLRTWSGLAGLPRAVAAVRDELVSFRDERGRELLDLPDAPRPDPDTPAPVRFLPAFDNAILGYDDRTRIVDDAHRGLSVAGERAVLVDGRVAGTWTVDADVVVITPLRRFSRADRAAVAEEGRAVAAFLSDGEHHRVRVGAAQLS